MQPLPTSSTWGNAFNEGICNTKNLCSRTSVWTCLPSKRLKAFVPNSPRRLFNEQRQSQVPDAQRATFTYFCIREKAKQLSLRGCVNHELVGTSTRGKKLLPPRAGLSSNFFTTCFMMCFHCLRLVFQALKLALKHTGQ